MAVVRLLLLAALALFAWGEQTEGDTDLGRVLESWKPNRVQAVALLDAHDSAEAFTVERHVKCPGTQASGGG